MSAVLAEKAVQILGKREDERAKTVKLFHRNAAIKHGIPWEDTEQDSATETTQTTTELSIIDKVVGKLVDKIGTPQTTPTPADGRDGRDGKDGANGRDADPKVVADLVAKMLPKIDADKIVADVAATVGTGKVKATDWRDLLKVIALSSLGAGAVAGPIGYYVASGDDKPPVIVQPQEKTGSLLQYLEDNGYSVGDRNGN